ERDREDDEQPHRAADPHPRRRAEGLADPARPAGEQEQRRREQELDAGRERQRRHDADAVAEPAHHRDLNRAGQAREKGENGCGPDRLHRFLAASVAYATRVSGYMLLLANPFPAFPSAGSYPVGVLIAPPEAQSRLTVLVRMLLAIPALLLSYVFRLVNNMVA